MSSPAATIALVKSQIRATALALRMGRTIVSPRGISAKTKSVALQMAIAVSLDLAITTSPASASIVVDSDFMALPNGGTTFSNLISGHRSLERDGLRLQSVWPGGCRYHRGLLDAQFTLTVKITTEPAKT
jgi:hypothetical protein